MASRFHFQLTFDTVQSAWQLHSWMTNVLLSLKYNSFNAPPHRPPQGKVWYANSFTFFLSGLPSLLISRKMSVLLEGSHCRETISPEYKFMSGQRISSKEEKKEKNLRMSCAVRRGKSCEMMWRFHPASPGGVCGLSHVTWKRSCSTF